MFKLAMMLVVGAAVIAALIQAQTSKPLLIYVVDVEGGNATLFVSPSGESVLIDTGNGGTASTRDADRIMAAVKDAASSQIDHLITTHWHGDHFGAMAELSNRIPIRNFIDHGPTVESTGAAPEFIQKVYPDALREGNAHGGQARRSCRHRRPRLAHRHLRRRRDQDARCRAREQPNSHCASFKPQNPDPGENAQSVGSIVTFGEFRVAHLGDLTWNKEFDLMCPTNRVGTIDLFVVTHHGQAMSNSDGSRPCHAAARRHHEQRHAEGRPARCDEDSLQLAGPGGPVADALLAAEWTGIHRAGTVHRQPRRRAACLDAGVADGRRRSPERPRPRRPCTMGRRTGSRCRRSPTARSPSPTHETDSPSVIDVDVASPTLTPTIYYADPDAAIKWLGDVLGLRAAAVYRDPSGNVAFAPLVWRTGVVFVSSRPPSAIPGRLPVSRQSRLRRKTRTTSSDGTRRLPRQAPTSFDRCMRVERRCFLRARLDSMCATRRAISGRSRHSGRISRENKRPGSGGMAPILLSFL